jgi:streptogramin lyase
MLKPTKIVTTLKAVREPIASAAVVAAIVAVALAAGAALRPHKRVGVDWENRQFMLRGEGQGPIVKEAPQGPVWYVAPHDRRI